MTRRKPLKPSKASTSAEDRHTTPRVAVFVPDPEGHKRAWQDTAAACNVSLAEFTRQALDAHCARLTKVRP